MATTWEAAGGNDLGDITAATLAVAREVFDDAQAAGHDVWFLWGWGPNPEHNSRRAIDFMVHNRAAGDWVRNRLWERRVRYGVRHVIWWQHVTSTVTQPGVVRLMEDRGDATANHYDHVHLLRNDVAFEAGGGDEVSEPIVIKAARLIEAQNSGMSQTTAGENVETVKWRIRDERWQQGVDAKLAALAAGGPVSLTEQDRAEIVAAVVAELGSAVESAAERAVRKVLGAVDGATPGGGA